MNLVLERKHKLVNGIFGTLSTEDGKHLCFTFEHSYPDSLMTGYESKIPIGTYAVVKRMSPKFGFTGYQILRVPGVQYAEIIAENALTTPLKDSEGCIFVGRELVNYPGPEEIPSFINGTARALALIFDAQDTCKSFFLEIK